MPGSIYSRLNRTFGTPPPLPVRREAVREKILRLSDIHPFQLESISAVRGQVSETSVIIVGAGFAGLTAGWWLSQHGYRVKIFEARNEVGGRVLTDRLWDKGPLVEFGGELIGRNHPTWLMFAQQFGLGLSVITPDTDYVYATDKRRYQEFAAPMWIAGRALDANEQENLYGQMEWAFTTLNRDAATVQAHMPWKATKADTWDHLTVADWVNSLDGRRCSDEAKAAIRFEIETNQTAPLEKQSYLGLLAAVKGGSLTRLSKSNRGPSEFWTDTEVFRCASGNQELARRLRSEIEKAGGSVLTNKPVKKIQIDRSGVAVTPEKADPVTGHWVIVAVPPSCWTKIDLPSDSKPAEIQTGSAVKFLATTQSRFWLQQGLAPSANDDRLGMVWEGSDNQIVPFDNGAELSVFAGGPLAQVALKDGAPDQHFADGLERLYPGFGAQKKTTKFKNWTNEEWTNGGYSCPAPGQVTTIAKALYQPHGRLVWAGEHCCMAYFGYMEAALQSGLHAAQLVAAGDKIAEAQHLLEFKAESSET